MIRIYIQYGTGIVNWKGAAYYIRLIGGEVLFSRVPSSQQATAVVAVVLRATIPWCCRRDFGNQIRLSGGQGSPHV
ncbi:hypothetical protein ACET3Z_003041 [Daucus carota]